MTPPRRARLRTALRAGCWLLIGTVNAWLAFGMLWKHNPADQSWLDGVLAFAALCSQTFAFHLGLVVAAACLVAVATPARRAALVLLILLVPTLGSRALTYVPALGAPAAAGLAGTGEPATLRVLSANLLYGRADTDALLLQINALKPDLIALQEFTSRSRPLAAALREQYPYESILEREDAFGQAVFSRTPFAAPPQHDQGPSPALLPTIKCLLDIDGQRLAFWNIHTFPPVGSRGTLLQRAHIAQLAGEAESLLSAPDAPDALIAAGDFNAPARTNQLRELRAAGLREAHHAVGVGPGTTWPKHGLKRMAPGIRLDHIMYAGAIEPRAAAVGQPIGSDHLPVWAELAIVKSKP